jgi:two-component system sensor histidine kinase ChiS
MLKKSHKKDVVKFDTKLWLSYALVVAVIVGFAARDYKNYLRNKRLQMESAAYEIEMNFTNTLGYAESVLNYLNRQIANSKNTNAEITKILSSFNQSHYGYDSIKDMLSAGMFYWVDSKKRLIASSAGPINPIDLSSRDYLENTKKDPWRIYSGTPVVGALSGQYVIPAGVGLVNNNGDYVGTSLVSFKLYNLVEKFKRMTGFYKTDFAIMDNNNKVILESESGLFSEDMSLMSDLRFSDNALREELVSNFSPFRGDGSYIIIRKVEKYPYKILIGYQNCIITRELLTEMVPYLIELLMITAFFGMVLVRLRKS